MWRDLAACDRFVKAHRKVSTPNMKAMGNAINYQAFKDLQNKQVESFTDWLFKSGKSIFNTIR